MSHPVSMSKRRINLSEVLEPLLNFWRYTVKLYISENSWRALFKASMLLLGASLTAMMQQGAFFYDKALPLNKSIIEFEHKVQRRFDEVDCRKPGALQLDCKQLTHEKNALKALEDAYYRVVMTGLQLGLWLLFFFIGSYVVCAVNTRVTSVVAEAKGDVAPSDKDTRRASS